MLKCLCLCHKSMRLGSHNNAPHLDNNQTPIPAREGGPKSESPRGNSQSTPLEASHPDICLEQCPRHPKTTQTPALPCRASTCHHKHPRPHIPRPLDNTCFSPPLPLTEVDTHTLQNHNLSSPVPRRPPDTCSPRDHPYPSARQTGKRDYSHPLSNGIDKWGPVRDKFIQLVF